MFRLVTVLFALLAFCTGELARADEVSPPTTKDLAGCLNADDQAICYLAIYGTYETLPLKREKEFLSRPYLLEELRAKYPDQAKFISHSTEDAFITKTSSPVRKQIEAIDQVITNENAKLTPEKTLEPVFNLLRGSKSQSHFAGQFTVVGGKELRIESYEMIAIPTDKKKSQLYKFSFRPEVIKLALANWEKELAKDIETYTYFNQEKSRLKLAKAYGLVGDREAVSRVVRQSEIPKKYQKHWQNLYNENYRAAWDFAVSDIKRNKKSLKWMGFYTLPELANGKGDKELLQQISSDLMNTKLLSKLNEYEIDAALKYINIASQEFVWNYLESSQRLDPIELVDLWERRGETQKVSNYLEKFENQFKHCQNYDKCRDYRYYLSILAKDHNVIHAKNVFSSDLQESLKTLAPFQPYDIELRLGNGFPSSIYWKAELDGHEGLPSIYDLTKCVKSRAEKAIKNSEHRADNLAAAKKCSHIAMERRGDPRLLKAEMERIALNSLHNDPQIGRYHMIETFLEMAVLIEGVDENFSKFLENSALQVMNEVPEVRLKYYSSLNDLAYLKLRKQGRF